MDYEKKYNEALERARALRREAIEKDYVEDYVKDYETIFPELRESEDERIRKTLAEYFGPEVQLDFVRGVPIQKIRDWLEKQKEQKPIGTDFRTAVKNLMNLHKIKNEFTEEDYDFQAKELLKLVKQKPAEWSEEDEKMIDTIVSVLGQYIDYKSVSGTGSGYATPRYSKEIAWLKSLRPDIYKNCNNRRKPGED